MIAGLQRYHLSPHPYRGEWLAGHSTIATTFWYIALLFIVVDDKDIFIVKFNHFDVLLSSIIVVNSIIQSLITLIVTTLRFIALLFIVVDGKDILITTTFRSILINFIS